jgi:hypothetical protein
VSTPTRLSRFSPVFPVKDLRAALEHYAALGFETHGHGDEDFYGFADRDGVGLHLSLNYDDHEHEHEHEHPDHDLSPAVAYLYVEDADALAAEWTGPGIGGTTNPVLDTPYGLREGGHVDPDGNIIRFGSPMPGR